MNEQRDWHDLKLQQLQDDNSRLRAELASFKENGCDGCELPLWWAEAIQLRAELADYKEVLAAERAERVAVSAELAAEKERGDWATESCTHWANDYAELQCTLAASVERCAKIAEEWDVMEVDTPPAIAAAIRASNAAPLESLPRELARHWLSEGGTPAPNTAPLQPEKPDIRAAKLFGCPEITCKHQTWCRAEGRCTGPTNAAPPHVEPSAAESKWEAAKSGLIEDQGDGNGRLCSALTKCCWPECNCLHSTEARMLELARKTIASFDGNGMELAALVIETFGGGK